MSDQADVLRTLVAGNQQEVPAAGSASAPMLLVAGAKGGVGATTLAVNLAIGCASQGNRTVLVDVDLCRADVAVLCGVNERHNTSDVLAARKNIHEILQRGPGGIQIAPGAWAPPSSNENSPAAHQRLLNEIHRIGQHADFTMVDVGADLSDTAAVYWRAADKILLVTTPDSISVMDAYAAVKVMASEGSSLPVHVLVNQARSSAEAWEVYQRINRSCERFLEITVEMAGFVPHDSQVGTAAKERSPFVLKSSACAASQAVQRVVNGVFASGADTEQNTIAMAQ